MAYSVKKNGEGMLDWLDAVSEAQEMARRHLEQFANMEEWPTALPLILEGLQIILENEPCYARPKFTGVALWGDELRLIIVNSLLSPGRKRFTIGHEIGHIVMEHYPPRSATQERLADIYATELLMPTPRMLAQLREHGPDISYLARLNAVSYAAMRRRLLELRQYVEE